LTQKYLFLALQNAIKMDANQRKQWIQSRQNKRNVSVASLVEGMLHGERQALGQAITLIESQNKADRHKALELLEGTKFAHGKSIRVGITGVPGVGKSTFIEAFGLYLLSLDKKVAVLAVDPSSEKNKGSILGDKTRMNQLSLQENVFIRPSPSGGTLGGLARSTNESILLCEAAGYDVVLVETVGVGQSETMVKQSVDFFLLLMLSGAGDELQGIKRGIMELADLLVITKADGDNIKPSKRAAAEYKNAMHLFPANDNDWIPQTSICSALENDGLDDIWKQIESFVNLTKINGWFEKNRVAQQNFWLETLVQEEIRTRFQQIPEFNQLLDDAENKIENGDANAFVMAQQIVNQIFEKYVKKS
jgi:LAO/AO transport system kinase